MPDFSKTEDGMPPSDLRFCAAGDTGLLVQMGKTIDPAINRRVHQAAGWLCDAATAGIVEVIPAYCTLLIVFDPKVTSLQKLVSQLRSFTERPPAEALSVSSQLIEIPVCYDEKYAPDIQFVADHAHCSVAEVSRMHSLQDYHIYMLGFAPGFPFLGGLPEALHTPRLATPRLRVPAGSVAIANDQTGIYPVESPGGWRIIGRTPLRLFNPRRKAPVMYRPGDRIRFAPINAKTFTQIQAEAWA